MKQIKNFAEANKALAQFLPNSRVHNSYSLKRPKALMKFLGNPQNRLKVIHVAGTSGKTSTSYYVAALLQATSKKVGLTVSPHIVEVNERVQIDLLPMAEQEFCKELSEFLSLIETSHIMPSYFECLIAFAYWEFVRQGVNYAVVEVGLGGLLDGTNVITRTDKVCIITDIGFDHVRVLGNTLIEIAAQKAGIIQSRNIVFSYHQASAITDTIKLRCIKKHAELVLIEPELQNLSTIGFLPIFQQRNYSLAEQVSKYIIKRDGLPPLSAQQHLSSASIHIPARMELFEYKGKTIILDGAHNAQKLHALVDSVKAKFPSQSVAAVISFSVLNADTRLSGGLQEIAQLVDHVIATEFFVTQDIHQQSIGADVIVQYSHDLGLKSVEIIRDPITAIKMLLTRPERILLVTGSFYLLNPIRPFVLELTK